MKKLHLTDYLIYNARHFGSKAAIIFDDQRLSWDELWQRVEPLSYYLADKFGTAQQEVVSLLMPNSIDFIISYLAILHSGHIASPLDPAYKQLELDAIIEQIPSKMLIIASSSQTKISDQHANVVLADEILSSTSSTTELLRLKPDQQIASLTFTSGTTGRPKIVPNTHANHIWNIKVCSQVWDWTNRDSLLISLPLSHWYGLVMGLSGALYHGNTLYLQQWFDEQATLRALASGKVTMFTHAASAYVKLAQADYKSRDLSSVRLCISGGAPLPPAVWQEFKERYEIEILETYGSSETGRIAGNSLNKRVLGSPGKILPEVNFRLSPQGEVQIKSPGVFPGYFHNPAATRASTTADGYWRTGDLAELRSGYVFLKGRVQERIRRFGYTISPRDVEWALHQNPKIKDVYVMGRQIQGEPNDELIYFIVSSLDDAEIHNYCQQNLLFAWRPDKLIRLDELPRTRSGKTRIGALQKLAGGQVA